jgi:hypothetical protein
MILLKTDLRNPQKLSPMVVTRSWGARWKEIGETLDNRYKVPVRQEE